jgi:hypothetical protein
MTRIKNITILKFYIFSTMFIINGWEIVSILQINRYKNTANSAQLELGLGLSLAINKQAGAEQCHA